ncbi:MAG: FAD-dependent oxidoreductase [Rubrivivax sp.]
MNIAVVGAGLAGLCAAKGLIDAGAGTITVFERRAGPGLETSYANGALLHPSAVDPWNSPGIGRFMLANLGNDESPVLLRPSALPSLLGWGLRFLRESSAARHRAHTLANVALALRSIELMRSLRENDGLEYGAAATGSLAIHRDAAEFARARERAAWLREHGVPSRVLDHDELVALEPALKPLAPALAAAPSTTAAKRATCLSLLPGVGGPPRSAWRGDALEHGDQRAAARGRARRYHRYRSATAASNASTPVLASAWWSALRGHSA